MNHNLQGIGMTSRRTRERMIDRLKQQGIKNNNILQVMSNIPRHIFVDEALASRSYEDTALPIGYNQTISQPYIVARMTELLLAEGNLSKVLEIGTGCGYQTAILAQLVEKVYSVERIGSLLKKAKNHLWDIKLKNISFQHNDGSWGWPEQAPYDGILVAAAPAKIPETLLQQMAVGGVMLIPVGTRQQELHKIIRTQTGYEDEIIESVSFVPFLAGRG
ncbi:MAG: protein-L-isoaspartate(D-aspartate) O-methyltransferase [Methylococcales symbiont of Iophon sp. n. MRB-2018]|nr:MAG: protein-L-isoaspartate(D-aspartate) O-methyltransferase [Methylococcales symbiont of Iophon sp. n. MRB-2018]KAF3980450.1 MAG: protein-L-isoaspartate(D-aspartate) O-methyltransferase [Methylococcales symbiont of Iophon sp. n. MRB-2018]